ncbi:Hypothetical predicted protein [Podarcis lilfordi]|uniref:Uncharacterized protein n=1 Tax=Podarcis lilfordi TaxID=74358 RepID=A0AA35P8B4_9SAUR|nr:Hypothetical predicted protein [Podarcis lilfordi]
MGCSFYLSGISLSHLQRKKGNYRGRYFSLSLPSLSLWFSVRVHFGDRKPASVTERKWFGAERGGGCPGWNREGPEKLLGEYLSGAGRAEILLQRL